MDFQEYPKALYLGDECRIVDDAAGEAVARAEGFRFCADAGQKEASAAAADEAPAGPTVEAVRAQLDAAGIEYDGRMGLKKLQALLPA